MTKIDIISGFLGAGKTTLIQKLLKEALSNTKVVLIENEFGEIGIDGGFLKEAGVEIREMNSGCICCSLVGDFGASLKEVLDTYQPDRVLIEPSGVGKLSDVMKAVQDVEAGGRAALNSAVVIVDASKCKMYAKNFGEFFLDQISHAGTVILSRTGNSREEKVAQCVELIRKHNPQATVITTPWEALDGKRILETIEGAGDWETALMEEIKEKYGEGHREHSHAHEESCHSHHPHEHEESCSCHHPHEHDESCSCGHSHAHDESCSCGHPHEHGESCNCGHSHEHHHADDVFTSWGLETAASYTAKEIEDRLFALEDEKKYGMILRAKGMVQGEDTGWIYFDYVPGEQNVRRGSAEYTGKICVIGAGLQEENLKTLFAK